MSALNDHSERVSSHASTDDDVGSQSSRSADSDLLESHSSSGGGNLVCSMIDGEHPLRQNWQFWKRPRAVSRKTRNSAQDWQRDMATLGSVITSVEEFWTNMKLVLEHALDENVFMFSQGVLPMWEDVVFENGGSVCLSFSGVAYQENARQTFLLLCLMLVGAQFIEQENLLHGCVLSWKSGVCRVELWLSTDDIPTLKLVNGHAFSVMAEFQNEVVIVRHTLPPHTMSLCPFTCVQFYHNDQTRIRYEWKLFKKGGEKQFKVDAQLKDIFNNSLVVV